MKYAAFLTALVLFAGCISEEWDNPNDPLNAPPYPEFTDTPPLESSSTSAYFGFKCNKSSCSFQCSLDSAAFAACSSPVTYDGLAAGSHTFQVSAGTSAPISYSWSICDSSLSANTLSATGYLYQPTNYSWIQLSWISNASMDISWEVYRKTCPVGTATAADCSNNWEMVTTVSGSERTVKMEYLDTTMVYFLYVDSPSTTPSDGMGGGGLPICASEPVAVTSFGYADQNTPGCTSCN